MIRIQISVKAINIHWTQTVPKYSEIKKKQSLSYRSRVIMKSQTPTRDFMFSTHLQRCQKPEWALAYCIMITELSMLAHHHIPESMASYGFFEGLVPPLSKFVVIGQ